MRIVEINERTPVLIEQLTKVWESSVRATHLFLTDAEIENIKKYIPEALNNIAHLIIIESEPNIPVAFMGIENQKLEMLFISSAKRGQGLGKCLINYGIEKYSINEVGVNEQNPQAIGFYEHMGFRPYKRIAHDEQGNPYPILYMQY